MALSTQNVWWRNSSAPGTFSGLFPRVRAYADPKPLPQAGGVRHRYTRTPPPRHSPGWLGGTLRAGPGPLIDPHGAHGGLGPTPPIPPLGHPTRHPLLVIWLRKRRLAGHPKNVLKNAAPRFGQPAPLIQKDLPKPKHEVYLRGVRPVPPCVLTEGPRRGTNFGGCLATAEPNFGQPESVSLLT